MKDHHKIVCGLSNDFVYNNLTPELTAAADTLSVWLTGGWWSCCWCNWWRLSWRTAAAVSSLAVLPLNESLNCRLSTVIDSRSTASPHDFVMAQLGLLLSTYLLCPLLALDVVARSIYTLTYNETTLALWCHWSCARVNETKTSFEMFNWKL